MRDAILVLNTGSSSVKCALYGGTAGAPQALAHGQVGELGPQGQLQMHLADAPGRAPARLPIGAGGVAGAVDAILDWLDGERRSFALRGAGHRVVHGGPDHLAPALATQEVLDTIARYDMAAPQHNAQALLGLQAVARRHPRLPQMVCFDTGFHHSQPAEETTLPLPREVTGRALRRYGFHGLSYEYLAGELARRAPQVAQGRVLAAHLGNGASLCALRAGRSIATTMGFTALDGLLMGRRCGALDPGVVLHLIREQGRTPDQVADLLYQHSGLLGVSGISHDMRTLLASPAPEAAAAVALFCHRAVREAGALIALMGGLDALVFTGGIGEHAAPVRQRICAGLAWLGLELDHAANEARQARISSAGSRVQAWVIPANEEAVIARHALQLFAAHHA